MRALRTFLLSAAGGVALLANVNASADTLITYVPNSLAEAYIANGPWTLHSNLGRNRHDASGIVPNTPTPYNPPTMKFGTPYANYCVGGQVQTAQGYNPMQPYYFPSCGRTPAGSKASSTTARATSRSRSLRRSRPIWAKAGFSKTRRWG